MKELRKVLYSSLLTFLCALTCFSQSEAGLNFGVGAATNTVEVVSVGGSFSKAPDNLESFYLGAYARFDLGEKFSLKPEFIFTQRGNIENNPLVQIKTLTDVIALPVWLEYEPIKRLSLKTGAEVAYALAQRTKVTNQSLVAPAIGLNDRLDFGLLFGLSYRFSHKWTIELRHTLGLLQQFRPLYISEQLLDPNAPPNLIPIVNQRARSRTFHVGINYRLLNFDN